MKKSSAEAVEQGRTLVLTCLARLIEQVFSAGCLTTEFQEAQEALEALPLDTTAFGLAVNRLANARRYLKSGEHGAARYELRLLRRSLER